MSVPQTGLSSCMYTRTKDRAITQGCDLHTTSWALDTPSSLEGSDEAAWIGVDNPASGGGGATWGDVATPTWPGSRRRRLTRRPRPLKTPTPCKHVPHREKPPQIVARRNARERRRVEAVNTAFLRLRKAVPIENNRGKRVSKVKTLHKAIEYITHLQRQLDQVGGSPPRDLNKENHRWGTDPHSHHHESLADLLMDFDEDDF